MLKSGLEVRAGLRMRAVTGKADVGSVANYMQDGVDEGAIGILGEVVIPCGRIKRREDGRNGG
jgi:hypothetical protein